MKKRDKNNHQNFINSNELKELKIFAKSLNLSEDDKVIIDKIDELQYLTKEECYKLFNLFKLILNEIIIMFKINKNLKTEEIIRLPSGIVFKSTNQELSDIIDSINQLLTFLSNKLEMDSISNDNIRTMRFMGYLSQLFSRVIMNTSQNGQDAMIPKTRNDKFLDTNGNEINDTILPLAIKNYQNKIKQNHNNKKNPIDFSLPDPDFLCKNLEFKQLASKNLQITPSQILNKSIEFSLYDKKHKEDEGIIAYDGFCFNYYDSYIYDKFWMFCTTNENTCKKIRSLIDNLQKIISYLMDIDREYELAHLFKTYYKGVSSIYVRPVISVKMWMLLNDTHWFVHNGLQWNTNSFYTETIDQDDFIKLTDSLESIFKMPTMAVQSNLASFISQFISRWIMQLHARFMVADVKQEYCVGFITCILNVIYYALGEELFISHMLTIIECFGSNFFKNIAIRIILQQWNIDANEILKNKQHKK